MERKKCLILYILKILESNTDEKHPIKQKKVVDIISSVMPCDRKTVARNITFMQEMGYPIVKTTKGYYVKQRRFSLDEIEFIKNAILVAPDVATINKSSLQVRLEETLIKQIERK